MKIRCNAKDLLIAGLSVACAALVVQNRKAQTAEDGKPKPIEVIRIYTGDDQQTHVEKIEVPLQSRGGRSGAISEAVDITGVMFRRTPPDYLIDWHNAPRRQYVVTLSGRGEVELGDGTKVPLNPGTILLAEDTTGQGHISRAIGSEDRISLFLPLAE